MKNIVFVDGQNLHLGTRQDNWSIDYKKLNVYLKENYLVSEIYYFIGYRSERFLELYENLVKNGFTLIFKEHYINSLTKKKGNVDSDIIFEIMKNIVDNINFNKIILVSGDGDYKKLIDYLIYKNKFEKIIFPNKKFVSALYKTLHNKHKDYMQNIKNHIEHKQK